MCHDWHVAIVAGRATEARRDDSPLARPLLIGRVMRKRSFYGLLSGIVSTVLAGAAGTVACGGGAASPVGGEGDGGKPAPPLPDESTFACTSPLGSVLANLRPASPVDYVELRSQQFDTQTKKPAREGDAGALEDMDAGDAGPLPPLLPRKTEASHGAPCATAGNRDACLAALADAQIDAEGWSLDRSSGEMVMPPTYRQGFLVYTRGDEVGIAKNPTELTAFLGTIDTIEEARLLMTTHIHDLECTTTPF